MNYILSAGPMRAIDPMDSLYFFKVDALFLNRLQVWQSSHQVHSVIQLTSLHPDLNCNRFCLSREYKVRGKYSCNLYLSSLLSLAYVYESKCALLLCGSLSSHEIGSFLPQSCINAYSVELCTLPLNSDYCNAFLSNPIGKSISVLFDFFFLAASLVSRL